MMLSALLGREAVFESGSTVLILDEIQECPEARTALKFFRTDGRYDVIGTGSLLGVKGYGKEPKSVPVGSETVIDMYPLDFEEFLWANGIADPVIEMLKKCLEKETPVPQALHSRMRQLLLQYTVVGGMPDAVQTFVDTKRMDEVLQIQRDIVRSYEDDMIKYAEKKDKSRIRECFQSIPKQLSRGKQEISVFCGQKRLHRVEIRRESAMDRRCRDHCPLLQSEHYGTASGWKCQRGCIQGVYERLRPFCQHAGGRHTV